MRKKQKRQRRSTVTELVEVWDRWQQGESSKAIGRVLGREPSSVYAVLLRHGGIRPRSRCRSRRVLWPSGRRGPSMPAIGRRRPISGPGIGLAARNHVDWSVVRGCVSLWKRSCERSGRRRLDEAHVAVQVSHETIYRGPAGLEERAGSICGPGYASRKGHGKGQIADIVSIRERPVAVEDRAVPGHWEGDLIAGSTNSYIATLVERHSRYVMLAKVASKETETVVSTLKQARQLPTELYKSLTWDRGLVEKRKHVLDQPDRCYSFGLRCAVASWSTQSSSS